MKHIYNILIFSGVLLVFGALFARGIFSSPEHPPTQTAQAKKLDGLEITFYRSPSCGCCAGHAEALEGAGAIVHMQNVDEITLQEIKQEYGIPFNKQSCHTALIDDYVVEGHVPIDALERLMTEKPQTRGITLPGMPIGTPGMPGKQTESYIVETLEGEVFWQKDPS